MAEDGERPPRAARRMARRILAWLLALVVAGSLAVALLDSPFGHRLVADRIAAYTTATGLRIGVGRITGSLFGTARLRDVTFADPHGVFARVPEAELDWRPLRWVLHGLDVRRLTLRRGTLARLPRLNAGDPDAPILPAFDIRIDRLEIENLKLAQAVPGAARRVDLVARADIRAGRALVRIDGKLGQSDRLQALLDAEPDRNRFDLQLDYAAPRGGLLAGLARTDRAVEIAIDGRGSWQQWDGALLAREDGRSLAAFRLGNRSGQLRLIGQVWPGDRLTGLAARAAGDAVSIDAGGSLKQGGMDGRFVLVSRALFARGGGKANLTENRLDGVTVAAALRDPALAGSETRLDGAWLDATLDGPLRELALGWRAQVAQATLGSVRLEAAGASGTARHDGTRWTGPMAFTTRRLITGNSAIDPRLDGLRATGDFVLAGTRLTAENLALDAQGLAARLVLRSDLARGGHGLAGVAAVRGWPVRDVGLAHADAKLVIALGGAQPWAMRMNLAGRLARVDNATLTSLAGQNIRFSGGLAMAAGQPLLIRSAQMQASLLTLTASGQRLADGRAVLRGTGRHGDYGPFRFDASLAQDGPRATLLLDDPWPAGGLRAVRLALAPIRDGFRVESDGQSLLGPFRGAAGLFAGGGAVRLAVERFQVAQTSLVGALTLARGRAIGMLRLTGGGLAGTIDLAPEPAGQGVRLALQAANARFGGEKPIIIAQGSLDARGVIASNATTLSANGSGQGISIGSAFIGRTAFRADLVNGSGRITASLAGRRGSRFDLQMQGDIAPGRIAALAQGEFAGRRIMMPRRAVFTREDAGWRLAPAQLSFGGGRAIASGRWGGRVGELDLALADLPLSLVDIVQKDMGLGGTASGLVALRLPADGPPTGTARLQVKGLTRSGLLLMSRPLDVALVVDLGAQSLETRAVLRDGGQALGRFQGRIDGLARPGALADRLLQGALFAQVRYAGAADALWRLVAPEEFDLTGPVALAADVRGTLADPRIAGTLSSQALRLRSPLTGTDVSGISAQGRFSGSRLELTGFSGRTGERGQISGSGSFDLAGLGTRGPGIDLRLAARDALVLDRADMAATVTGPLRIVSDGTRGTIAGRVELKSARWRLGRAATVAELPEIRTREVNRRADYAPPASPAATWHYLIDTEGNNRVHVEGLGLDSE